MAVKNGERYFIRSSVEFVLKRSSFDFSIKNLSYLPRWIILSIDVFMVVMAGFLSHFLLKGIGLDFPMNSNILFVFGLFLSVSVLFFWIFRTYSGIIRHSSFIDAVKLFMAQSFAFLVLLLGNTFSDVFFGGKLFLNTRLFISVTLSFTFLLLYRIIVKQLFEHYMEEATKNNGITNVLIYGTDSNAISVANALRFEVPSRFKVVGFVDKQNKNASKRILGLPILHQDRKIPVLLRSYNAQALIIADKTLNKDEKLVLVDECLDYNFKVLSAPDLSDWQNQEDVSRKIKNFQIHDLLERKPIQLDSNVISNQIENKVILITGAAGSIGSEIVWQVSEFKPSSIILVDQAETPLHHLSLELSKLKGSGIAIHSIIADIRDYEIMKSIFSKYLPNVVYHAAAYKHVPLMEDNPNQAVYTNIKGTKNLADLAVFYEVERFVMVSTDKAVNPSNVMGASKRIAEKYVQSLFFSHQKKEKKTLFITTRFGNVLGSNGSVVPLFTQQIANGGPVTITHPEIIRYFMTIPEACQLVLEAGAMGTGGEIFIFDMGKPVKIIDLAKKMIRLAGLRPDKDIKIEIVGLRPGEKLYEELLNDKAKSLPTHHEKIMIATETPDDYDEVNRLVDDLFDQADAINFEAVVAQMKVIVPEYKSMNSSYEVLDLVRS